MNHLDGTCSAWPTINLKNDNTLITVTYSISRNLHERFLDKVYAEGYTKQEAVTQLIQNYVDSEVTNG